MSEINASTIICGVIGAPVRHSLSPAIHNAGYAELGINFVYVAFEVEQVGAALMGVRGLGIRGLSVTIPHKLSVIEHLDEIDALAQTIGSVNTVVNREGKLWGTSTDGIGAYRAVCEAGVELAGRQVVILGNGGSARALCAVFCERGNPDHVLLLGRNLERVQTLACSLQPQVSCAIQSGCLNDPATAARVCGDALIINTTSVGMHPYPDQSPLPADWIMPTHTVFDIVYTPKITQLLKDASSRHAKVIFGLEMFLYQAAEQFELFTRQPAPIDVMREVVEQKLG